MSLQYSNYCAALHKTHLSPSWGCETVHTWLLPVWSWVGSSNGPFPSCICRADSVRPWLLASCYEPHEPGRRLGLMGSWHAEEQCKEVNNQSSERESWRDLYLGRVQTNGQRSTLGHSTAAVYSLQCPMLLNLQEHHYLDYSWLCFLGISFW